MRLIATKDLKYATRRLRAGDEFDAPDLHAMLLIGYGKAARQDEAPPMPKADPDTEILRRTARALGIVVDGRWGDRRLQAEIDLARQQHQ